MSDQLSEVQQLALIIAKQGSKIDQLNQQLQRQTEILEAVARQVRRSL